MKHVLVIIFSLVLASFAAKPWHNNEPPPGPDWGFYGHEKINYFAVFLLPPSLLKLYKTNYIGERYCA